MKTDIHFHCIPENYISAIREKDNKYPERVRMGSSGQEQVLIAEQGWRLLTDYYQDPERMLRDMDESERDVAVLSMSPRLLHYELDAETGEEITRKVNDGISRIVNEQPDRFVGMAAVPLQHPQKAINELERAVNHLGMRGVLIGSNINGRNLDEPEFLPFFEKAQDLGILVFVHPCTVAGVERMGRYYLKNLIGNPTDTALAIGSLIYGGILERLPELKLCFAHAGGSIPSLIGRLDHGYKVRQECKSATPKAPSEYLKLLYFDTIAHSDQILLYLIQTVGSDKVLLGSDYPYDVSDPQPVATVANLQQISEQDKERIWGGNAERLLKIRK